MKKLAKGGGLGKSTIELQEQPMTHHKHSRSYSCSHTFAAIARVAAAGCSKAAIQSFAHTQENCLSRHQAFCKPFVEHFYGTR